MAEPVISPKFDLEDIRHIRQENSQRHRALTTTELQKELSGSTRQFLEKLEKHKNKPSA